jgi:exportin-5
MTHLEEQRQYPAYSDAVRELHSLASHELRRLSMRYADYFFVSLCNRLPKVNSTNQGVYRLSTMY